MLGLEVEVVEGEQISPVFRMEDAPHVPCYKPLLLAYHCMPSLDHFIKRFWNMNRMVISVKAMSMKTMAVP